MDTATLDRHILPDDPWTVKPHWFPADGSDREKLAFLLNYAVLAPSGHNTQPWLFQLADDAVWLYADRTRALAVVDPGDRELIMSCGAALFHLRTAIQHFGYQAVITTFPDRDDPDALARVRLGPPYVQKGEDYALFGAIKRRVTNRSPFERTPIPAADRKALRRAATTEGAHLHIFDRETDKQALATLIAEGDRIQGGNPSFRRELAAWVHHNRSRSRDGIPGYALGLGDIKSLFGPLVVRRFEWGGGQAVLDHDLATGSPLLAVLSTQEDTPVQWLAAGQALDRVLLTATRCDIQASFLNQPIEVATLREEVRAFVGGGLYPQVILRMGYSEAAADHTPRRPVAEVLC